MSRSSPSQALQASQDASASHNQRVGTALVLEDTATIERTDVIDAYIAQHRRDRRRLYGPQGADTVDDQRRVTEGVIEPLRPLGLLPPTPNGGGLQYPMAIRETTDELILRGSDSERADDT